MTNAASDLLPGLNVSRETLSRLEAFSSLIRKWTPAINLIAPASVDDLWQRHIVDSAQLLLIASPTAKTWVDLGSGAGLPGIVVALLSPTIQVTLIESDQRKAVFLNTCNRELGLGVTILSNRAEAIAPLAADVVSARALAPLASLLPMVLRHIAPDGVALLPKGKTAQSEIEAARRFWAFDLQAIQSQTNPQGAILHLERIARV